MKNFSIGLIIRIVCIVLLAVGFAFEILQKNWIYCFLFTFFLILLGFNLFNYVSALNRKMKRLFESIQYQDFAITFKADNALGKSFSDLNQDLNNVISSFNQVRAEREATLHFVNAIVQQINVGIISYNTEGKIELSNQAANKLLKVYRLNKMADIAHANPEVFAAIGQLKSGESILLTLNNDDLSISVTEIQMRGRRIRLVAIHNIRSELQNRELEAWQNLTKVLRHEIMNSVTPIVSLAETMRDIVEHDIKANSETEQEAIIDLKDALTTVQRRGNGIMKFVNAYREFTSIPMPIQKNVSVSALIQAVEGLYAQKIQDDSVVISFSIASDFELFIDQEQIEQVLINLIKNAVEAKGSSQKMKIEVRANQMGNLKIIEVIDNGLGIEKGIQDKIFIPFFTTKKLGSGIGLSLSRQILQLHGGTLNYYQNKPSGSIFILNFN
jgi:two-component system, NtrC family, nitrogen regulation sensor histidine kinase NtrY